MAVNLALPFTDDFVKLLGLPVHGSVEDLGLVQVVNGSLSLRQSCGQLHLGHLQLLALGNSVSLILLAPALSFTLSLGGQAENILATGGLLIEGLAGAIKLMLQVPVFAQEESPLASLIVAEGLHVIELGSKGRLLLGQDVQVVVKVSNDAEKVRVFNGNLVL